MNGHERDLIDRVWQYPLYQAFARRRALRFPPGAELKRVPFPYKSDKKPIPLSELETALLCWAGRGVTGLCLADIDLSVNTFMSWVGRTHPNPCNDQHQELLFINDDGVFLYRPPEPTKAVEIETPEDRIKILESYRAGLVRMMDERPTFPPASMLQLNLWNANFPGQTVFFPIVDLTWEYINFLFLAFGDEHYQVVDDKTGKPAGVGEWVEKGYLSGAPVPLSMLETLVFNVCVATAHYMAQNIDLARAALGLGGYVWGGYLSMILLGGTPLCTGLGFRFGTGKDGMPTALGKDGFIEPLVPPYVKDMDEAVDRVVDLKFGPGGLFAPDCTGARCWKERTIVESVKPPSEETIACTKAYCRYVYETYGRFPVTQDAVQMPIAITAQHLDLDFYERYYPGEIITPEIRDHMSIWH